MRTGISLLAALVLSAGALGCLFKTPEQRGAEQAKTIGMDMRRAEAIRNYSPPAEAKDVMGREPDAVQQEGEYEVHYYFIREASEGESLRLVYKDGRLVDRSFVRMSAKR